MQKYTAYTLLAMAAIAVSPVQARVTVNESVDISEMVDPVYVPCANGGIGETIELTGPLHVQISTTINKNIVTYKEKFQPQGVIGVGLTGC